MAGELVTVDGVSDPVFVIVTTKVPKAGFPEGSPRREWLAQASALNGLSHGVDQLTLEKRDLISASELRKLDAATTNWGGMPAFVAVIEGGVIVDAVEKKKAEEEAKKAAALAAKEAAAAAKA